MSEIQPIRAAAIADGIVINVEMIGPGFERDGVTYVPSETAGIGDRYEKGEFVRPEIEPQPDPVPEIVSMRQAKIQLSRAGLLAQANAAIGALSGQPGEEARLEWEYATSLRRDHPLVAGIGRALGLDDAAKDDLFRAAALIP